MQSLTTREWIHQRMAQQRMAECNGNSIADARFSCLACHVCPTFLFALFPQVNLNYDSSMPILRLQMAVYSILGGHDWIVSCLVIHVVLYGTGAIKPD